MDVYRTVCDKNFGHNFGKDKDKGQRKEKNLENRTSMNTASHSITNKLHQLHFNHHNRRLSLVTSAPNQHDMGVTHIDPIPQMPLHQYWQKEKMKNIS